MTDFVMLNLSLGAIVGVDFTIVICSTVIEHARHIDIVPDTSDTGVLTALFCFFGEFKVCSRAQIVG